MKIVSLHMRLYRYLLSPFLTVGFGINCRYEETCSHYMERKIREYGLIQGFKQGLIRFVSCNPFVNH